MQEQKGPLAPAVRAFHVRSCCAVLQIKGHRPWTSGVKSTRTRSTLAESTSVLVTCHDCIVVVLSSVIPTCGEGPCTGMVLPQEHTNKNEAPSLRSKAPPRQEQEASAEVSAWACHVGNDLAVLSLKGHPHQISGLETQELEAPLLKIHLFLLPEA